MDAMIAWTAFRKAFRPSEAMEELYDTELASVRPTMSKIGVDTVSHHLRLLGVPISTSSLYLGSGIVFCKPQTTFYLAYALVL